MSNRDLQNTRTESLAGIMDLTADEPLWHSKELAAILNHQLAAPVAFDLGFLDAVPQQSRSELRWDHDPPIASFRDLFDHPDPPMEMLQLTKEFAKACRTRPEAPLPDKIATVLYLLSIVTALVKRDQRISKLDSPALQQRIQWATEQPWVDDHTRELLREGRRALGAEESDAHG
ncbi:MAG: hypothetical protein RBS80_22065 [Thermoguttaceae bacterium]|jgi:hypothetical protein|nr:hypothetical protein [Thermoguttaceae bacterium]